MKTLLSALALATLISSCSYTTYVVPPERTHHTSHTTKSASVSSYSAPDSFQAVTKPSSYSN